MKEFPINKWFTLTCTPQEIKVKGFTTDFKMYKTPRVVELAKLSLKGFNTKYGDLSKISYVVEVQDEKKMFNVTIYGKDRGGDLYFNNDFISYLNANTFLSKNFTKFIRDIRIRHIV